MVENNERQNTEIKNFERQKYEDVDDKDFVVRTIDEIKLIDSVPGLDSEFDRDMYNFGDEEDLPDSDRLMQCQAKGIKQESCFDL